MRGCRVLCPCHWMLRMPTVDDTEGLNAGTKGNWEMQPLGCRFTGKTHELFFGGLFDRPVSLPLDLKAESLVRRSFSAGWV